MTASRRNAALLFFILFAVTLALRLCHWHILWVDEDYHMAAGIQTLHGKMLYHDVWYDKPPLAAWLYAAMGAFPGWPLRLFGAAWVMAICGAAWRFARELWGDREAYLAAGLMAFFLNFDFAPAVLPVAPDLLMMLPAIVAAWCAWRGRPLAAGIWCGLAFQFHTKGVFPLALCALLAWRSLPRLLLGFLIPNAAVYAVIAAGGALGDYFRQVWEWGIAYARSSPEAHPMANGARRILDWLGFHAALAIGGAVFWWHHRKRQHLWLAAWLLLSLVGVALGARFSPRYFLQLLAPLALVSARALARNKAAALVAGVALLIPLVRFAPRYFSLAQDLVERREPQWSDIVLDQDSQAAAALINARKRPGDTLLVWGYRPDIFVYTRMAVAARYWDSQLLTGVPADRHLFDSISLIPEWAARNRAEVTASRPAFVVDSLSVSNPRLAIDGYPELRTWLGNYRLVARTRLSLIYQK